MFSVSLIDCIMQLACPATYLLDHKLQYECSIEVLGVFKRGPRVGQKKKKTGKTKKYKWGNPALKTATIQSLSLDDDKVFSYTLF